MQYYIYLVIRNKQQFKSVHWIQSFSSKMFSQLDRNRKAISQQIPSAVRKYNLINNSKASKRTYMTGNRVTESSKHKISKSVPQNFLTIYLKYLRTKDILLTEGLF